RGPRTECSLAPVRRCSKCCVCVCPFAFVCQIAMIESCILCCESAL
uniref:Uncharacterized protein n=1 Tax=Anopheles quadriannulatus TaxID=34691 RepID=A0A182XQS8_ANOQN